MVYTMVEVVLPQWSGEVGGDEIVHTLLCVTPRNGLCWTWIRWMFDPLLGLLIKWLLKWCSIVACSNVWFPCSSSLFQLAPLFLFSRFEGWLPWWWRCNMVFPRLIWRLSWWWRRIKMHRFVTSGSASPKACSMALP